MVGFTFFMVLPSAARSPEVAAIFLQKFFCFFDTPAMEAIRMKMDPSALASQ
jgi:hypothetical protein